MKYEFHPEAVLEFEAAADFLRRTIGALIVDI